VNICLAVTQNRKFPDALDGQENKLASERGNSEWLRAESSRGLR